MVKGRPTRVIYKRFNPKKTLETLLNLVRPSRAGRAWQAGQHLKSRGLPTPQNLAYVVKTGWGPLGRWLTGQAYLVTIKAEPSITLGDYARTVLPLASPDDRRAQIRRLTLALARLLRVLHERSMSDRDLKAANILIEGDPAADEIALTLDRPCRRPAPAPAPERPAAPEPGEAADQPGRRPRPDQDRRPAVPPGLSAMGPVAPERLERSLAESRAAHRL